MTDDMDWDIRSADYVLLPHPRDVVGPAWTPDDRARVLSYLRSGWTFATFDGLSYCRCGCPEVGGCQEFTDGIWVWPEALPHYVAERDVCLPDAFLETAEVRAWRVPPQNVVEKRGRLFRDLRTRLERLGLVRSTWDVFNWLHWIAWAETCRQQRPA